MSSVRNRVDRRSTAILAAGLALGLSGMSVGREPQPAPRRRAVLEGHSLVGFAPEGGCVLTLGDGGRAMVWEASTGRLRCVARGTSTAIYSAVVAPDSASIVLIGWGARPDTHVLTLCDAKTGMVRAELGLKTNMTPSVDFAADGRTITLTVAGLAGEPLRDADPFRVVVDPTLEGPMGDARRTESNRAAARAHGIDVTRGRAMLKGRVGFVHNAAFAVDGRTMATQNHTLAVRSWDAASGRRLEEIAVADARGYGTFAVSTPDGRTLATPGPGSASSVALWNLATRRAIVIETGQWSLGVVRFSPDGRTLATASTSADHSVKLWEVVAGAPRIAWEEREALGIRALAFSPDGRTMAVAVDVGRGFRLESPSGAIRLREAATGKLVGDIKQPGAWILATAFSPDGRTLAAAIELPGENAGGLGGMGMEGKSPPTDRRFEVKLWDASTSRPRGSFPIRVPAGGGVPVKPALSFADDGTLTAFVGTKVVLADAVSLLPRAAYDLTARIDAVATAPDGRSFAVVAPDRIATVRDMETGRVRATLAGPVAALAYSPDGGALVSAGVEYSIELWDLDEPR